MFRNTKLDSSLWSRMYDGSLRTSIMLILLILLKMSLRPLISTHLRAPWNDLSTVTEKLFLFSSTQYHPTNSQFLLWIQRDPREHQTNSFTMFRGLFHSRDETWPLIWALCLRDGTSFENERLVALQIDAPGVGSETLPDCLLSLLA